MPNQETSITIRAYDKASYAVLGVAANLETLSKRMQQTSQIGYAMGQLGRQLAPLQNRLSNLGDKWSAAFQRIGGVGLAVGGAAFGLNEFAKSAVNAVDRVGDLSARFGISSQALQVYGSLIEEAGGSMEDAASAIGKLKLAMGEATHGGQEQAAAFAGIGISVQQLKKLSPEDVLLKMASAFKKSHKDIEKDSLLRALFGKSGTIYRDVMNQGAEAIKKRRQELAEDGVLLTAQQIADADRLDRRYKRMERTIGGIKNRVGMKLADRIVGGNFQKWLAGDGGKKIEAEFDRIFSAENITAFKDGMIALGRVVLAVGSALKSVVDTIGPTATAWLGLGIILAPVGAALASTAKFMWDAGRAMLFLGGKIPGVARIGSGLARMGSGLDRIGSGARLAIGGVQEFGAAATAALVPVAIAASAIYATYKAIAAYQNLSNLQDAHAKDNAVRQDKRGAYNDVLRSVGGDKLVNGLGANTDFQQLNTVVSGFERSGQVAPGTAARLAALPVDVSGKMKIEISTTGGASARVTELKKEGRMDFEASTGPVMAGG